MLLIWLQASPKSRSSVDFLVSLWPGSPWICIRCIHVYLISRKLWGGDSKETDCATSKIENLSEMMWRLISSKSQAKARKVCLHTQVQCSSCSTVCPARSLLWPTVNTYFDFFCTLGIFPICFWKPKESAKYYAPKNKGQEEFLTPPFWKSLVNHCFAW